MSGNSGVIRDRRARVQVILPILKRLYPDARCSLEYKTPLQLLVATILSAQCTDARVNVVTRSLFQKYRSAADYARADPAELERDIQSTGFFRNKARSIREMARALLEHHGGSVPSTMEELTALAGVGRKTANVVLGNAFGREEGVTVDTHVARLSHRLGLTRHKTDAVKIERDLMEIVPRDTWTLWSHLLIHHGRSICDARRPRCADCALLAHCPAGQKLTKATVAGKQPPRATAARPESRTRRRSTRNRQNR
jgi:endonuclease-3